MPITASTVTSTSATPVLRLYETNMEAQSVLRPLLNQAVADSGKTIVVVNAHGSVELHVSPQTLRSMRVPNTLGIIFWGVPEEILPHIQSIKRESLFGISLTAGQNDGFGFTRSSFESIPNPGRYKFFYNHGDEAPLHNPYAIQDGNILYILFDLPHASSPQPGTLLTQILEHTEFTKPTITSLEDSIKHYIRSERTKLSAELETCRTNRAEALKTWQKTMSGEQTLIAAQKSLRSREKMCLKTIKKQQEQILKNPKVESVVFNSFGFVVTTKMLYVNHRPRKFEIGAFEITFGYDFPAPTWKNLTRQVTGYNSQMHAPHIFQDGQACLGNAAPMFASLAENWAFDGLVNLAIRFVESCNVADSAGRFLVRWPLVSGPALSSSERLRDDPEEEVTAPPPSAIIADDPPSIPEEEYVADDVDDEERRLAAEREE